MWRVTLALIAGGMHAVSLSWPDWFQSPLFSLLGLQHGQPVWWLQILAMATLAWLLSGNQSWRAGALLGWLFGTAWLAGSVGWLFVAMHTYGGLPFMLAALAVFALSGLLALFYAVAAALFVVLNGPGKTWSALIFAALWLVAELARGTWLTGFGWGGSGYAHVDGPLAGIAPWLGVYGLSAVAAWLAISLLQQLAPLTTQSRPHRIASLALLLALLALPALYQRFAPALSRPSGELSLTLLQGNIPQDEKFEPGSGVPLALRWYAEQLQNSRSALIIAPETAIPVLPQDLPPDYWAALQQRFGSGQQAALIGTPLGDYQQGYTNSVIGLKPAQTRVWRYDKRHLVPFGEFIPPFFKWFTAMMKIPLGDFNLGDARQAPFEWQGQKLATNICYEDLFSEELAVQFINPAQAPNVFINISNLAWFGDGLAIDQHLQISRLRALEFERPFVLATNTGATAIVDHHGQVISQLARGRRAVLVGSVQGRSGITPYAWWVARFGLWPLWLLALGLIGLAALRGLAQARPAPRAECANQREGP
jgi:apolipoprotein N-acyltransferase